MIRAEIEVFTPETEPEADREICFYFDGRWESGVFLEEFYYGREYGKHKTFSLKASPSHVELWFYPPERDTLE